MAVKFICDRCKIEMTSALVITGQLSAFRWQIDMAPKVPRFVKADLCETCSIDLKAWLKGEL